MTRQIFLLQMKKKINKTILPKFQNYVQIPESWDWTLLVGSPTLKKRLIKEVLYDIKYHRLSIKNLNAGTIPFWKIDVVVKFYGPI